MNKSSSQSPDIQALTESLRNFTKARDWEQFHSPKNLVMGLVSEAGELVEHFQWLTEKQSEELSVEQQRKVKEEVADIQIYLIMLADRLDIDLMGAAREKIAINEQKYPADKAQGSNRKYTDL